MAFTQFTGNPDFRGYLAYLGQNGDQTASNALNFTGNDGGIDTTGSFTNYVQGANSTPTQEAAATQNYQNYISNAYNTYQGLNPTTHVLGDVTGGTTSNIASPTVDPQAQAYYDQQIGNVNSAIGRLDNQATIGHQNVLDSYNTAYNTLIGQKASTDTTYQNSKNTTGQDNVIVKNNILN